MATAMYATVVVIPLQWGFIEEHKKFVFRTRSIRVL